ncbi:MAG: L-lactate dehydrogenase [Proteobacteria bacterium]|nr:L-lactate dehydrogenase [Pseudomonadota bacterium]
MKAISIGDYRELARRRLPRFLFDYIDGGSFSEETLRRNVGELQTLALRQRVLRDVSGADLSTTVLGQSWQLPVALAPIGLGGLVARRGETQAVRAAETAGIPFILSTVAACPIEEVAAAATQPFWFQLYMIRDRAFMRDLLARASAARCSTLVFTVDMPVPGTRYRDYHSGLAGAAGLGGQLRRVAQALGRPRWAWDVGLLGRPHGLGNIAPLLGDNTGLEDFFAWMRGNFDPQIGWRDLDWIRAEWKGPIVLKGVLDAEDAREAAANGVDGIIVSNHGGRQLDGVPASALALPEIAAAVGDKLTVLADGGVRSGLDVLRLLALGARGVLLGRAWVWALAAGGQPAVEQMLSQLAAELRVAMALTGVRRIADIDSSVLLRK